MPKQQLSMFEEEPPRGGGSLFPTAGVRQPLAARMRPRRIEEYIGQEQLLGPGKPLRRALEKKQLFSSMILWGPPGTGKTTLARLLATGTDCRFEMLSAVTSGIKEVREVVERARAAGGSTVLFIDEIHRFNKTQQDALLPHVEEGLLTLVGATTENPYFEVNRALLSRSRVFPLKSLERDDIRRVLEEALRDPERGFGKLELRVEPDILDYLVETSGGDARIALNSLEMTIESSPYDRDGHTRLTLESAQEAVGQKVIPYDKKADYHYDVVSAFIKSVRGSDPDAALFWLARMVLAGEDPKFIVRRLLILAAEDVGLADPNALLVTTACAHAVDRIGFPEAKFHLAEATIYLASAPKSNSTMAYFQAEEAAEKLSDRAVPAHLRDSHYSGAKTLGHGKGYLYPHDYSGHFVPQSYWPEGVAPQSFYQPGDLGFEAKIGSRLQALRSRQEKDRPTDE